MSSILKALKKLENETAEKEPQQFVWPQPIDTKASFTSSLKDRFSLKFFSYKMALVFFFSTTLILLFFITYPETFQNNLESAAPVITANRIEKKIETTPKIVVEKTEEGIDTFVAIEPKDKPFEDIAKIDVREEEYAINEEEILDIEETIEERTEAINTQEVVSEKEITVKPTKLTESGWLTLQGISWSSEPLKRMAVINSIIAREGKIIEGGRVSRIDKKYVVIEKNGEELMLRFD